MKKLIIYIYIYATRRISEDDILAFFWSKTFYWSV